MRGSFRGVGWYRSGESLFMGNNGFVLHSVFVWLVLVLSLVAVVGINATLWSFANPFWGGAFRWPIAFASSCGASCLPGRAAGRPQDICALLYYATVQGWVMNL